MGCAGSPLVGCLGFVIVVAMVIISFVAAIFGFFNPSGDPLGGEYLPPVGAQVEPYLGTPTVWLVPTMEPTRTPLPGPPTQPAYPSCELAPPNPSATPDVQATETAYRECQQRLVGMQASATAAQAAWQATATAYPTNTPIPPTPVGGGPRGNPISMSCAPQFDGCAAGPDHRRVETQKYGCTTFPEVALGWQGWCQDNTHQSDDRWNRAGVAGGPPCQNDNYCWGHEGADFDTGHYYDPGHEGEPAHYHGEPLIATLQGQVQAARVVTEGMQGWTAGFGTNIRLEDTSHVFKVTYGHMSRMGQAVYLCATPSPNFEYGQPMGRYWQAGDCIAPGAVVGYTGYTGYTSRGMPCGGCPNGFSDGEHLHYQIERDGISVNPWPYIARGAAAPLPVTPVPYRRPGG